MLLENKGYKDNRKVEYTLDGDGKFVHVHFYIKDCVFLAEPKVKLFDPECFECMVDCKESSPEKHAKCLSLQHNK